MCNTTTTRTVVRTDWTGHRPINGPLVPRDVADTGRRQARCFDCGEWITWSDLWCEWHSVDEHPARHYVNVCAARTMSAAD